MIAVFGAVAVWVIVSSARVPQLWRDEASRSGIRVAEANIEHPADNFVGIRTARQR